jgi:RND family efflux transporter MFP subunit
MTMKPGYIFLLPVFLLVASCRNETPVKPSEKITSVRVTEPSVESVSVPVHSSGILMSEEETKLSFKTGGIVLKINCKEGEKVKKGDILASLNLSEINAQVSQARSGYDKSMRDYNRTKNLYSDSVATLEQLQNASTALSVARSNLDIALFNQSHSKIVAPDNGIILKQFVKPNELVAPGYPVFLYGTSGTTWKVRTGLSDRNIVKINIGDSAVVKMDAWPGIEFPASVEQVGEMANPVTGTYETELIMEDKGFRLAAGFVVSVDIFPSEKEPYLLVPVESIVEADGQSGYVFVVDDSSFVSKVKVGIIAIIGTKAAIRSNQKEIRQIVSAGAAYLRDGERVRIAD